MMNYAELVAMLEARPMMPDRPLSLEPMKKALERIGFFEKYPFWPRLKADPCRVIIVSGTNGKGSVCATLEALLLSAGERVGLYTSPHLMETTERYRLNGQDISKNLFCQAYHSIENKVADLGLTHFEMLTVMAIWLFCSGEAVQTVDRLILEVGLGGLWDATNVVPHGMAIITALGMDHENLLGSSITQIARNKFGVIHGVSDFLPNGMKVVHSALPVEVLGLAKEVSELTKSHWKESVTCECQVKAQDGEPRWSVRTPWGDADLKLPGKRGAQNTALALTAFSELGFDPAPHLAAIGHVRWQGRMEKVLLRNAPCPVYVSGDHNPHGVASLLELLPYYSYRQLHLLVGVGKDKDCDGVLEQLFSIPRVRVYLTETPLRGRKLSGYGEWSSRAAGAWAEPEEAFEHVLAAARPGDLLLVSGSLYLVGLLKKRWLDRGLIEP